MTSRQCSDLHLEISNEPPNTERLQRSSLVSQLPSLSVSQSSLLMAFQRCIRISRQGGYCQSNYFLWFLPGRVFYSVFPSKRCHRQHCPLAWPNYANGFRFEKRSNAGDPKKSSALSYSYLSEFHLCLYVYLDLWLGIYHLDLACLDMLILGS